MSTTIVVDEQPPRAIPASITLAPMHKEDAFQDRIPVLLPDMFVSFLAQKPRVNPHYERVRKESEEWINRFDPPFAGSYPQIFLLRSTANATSTSG